MMGYNFTEDVRLALVSARDHSGRLRHEYVGTEHLLLGLIDQEASVAVDVLRNLSANPDAIRLKLENTLVPGKAERDSTDNLPYTTRSKKILELAMHEASDLGHEYVGTEHLLLGLLREEKGIAAQVLVDAGLTMDALRAEVLRHPSVPASKAGLRMATRSVDYERPGLRPDFAYRLFWTTLGIVILIESARPLLAGLVGSGASSVHVMVLAMIEIVSAVLFLIPRTMPYGAWLLLAVFTVAAVVHLMRGEFPGHIFVYAAGTLLVLAGRRRELLRST
jgi:hypothetical protein